MPTGSCFSKFRKNFSNLPNFLKYLNLRKVLEKVAAIFVYKIHRKRREMLKLRTVPNFVGIAAFWKTRGSNIRLQATFQLSLVAMQNKSLRSLAALRNKSQRSVVPMQNKSPCSLVAMQNKSRRSLVAMQNKSRSSLVAIQNKSRRSLATIQNKSRRSSVAMQNESLRYWIMHSQSWVKKIWINRQNTVFHKLWQKEFKMGQVTFDYSLNMIG